MLGWLRLLSVSVVQMNKENGRVNPTEIFGVVFIILIAITFIAGGVCFYFSSKGEDITMLQSGGLRLRS